MHKQNCNCKPVCKTFQDRQLLVIRTVAAILFVTHHLQCVNHYQFQIGMFGLEFFYLRFQSIAKGFSHDCKVQFLRWFIRQLIQTILNAVVAVLKAKIECSADVRPVFQHIFTLCN